MSTMGTIFVEIDDLRLKKSLKKFTKKYRKLQKKIAGKKK